jgi:3',5'-cyclic AMP phosphodiesterase CpdA
MPRIAITSDLHLGITPSGTIRRLAENIAAEQPDLTVLAGDLGEGLPNVVACLDLFRGLPGTVAVLAGNHDVWARSGHSSQELWERALPRVVRDARMLWLEDTVWLHDGVAVAGSLAWYDYSAVDLTWRGESAASFAANKGRYNMDAKFVSWPWSDVEFATNLGDGLCARLAALECDPAVRAVVAVTHVPLFEEQMLRQPHDPKWGYTNAYFGNLTLGWRIIGMGKLRTVVSGHTHVGRQGVARRRGAPEQAPIAVYVLPSDYHKPTYMLMDDAALDVPMA